jgi:hypothetical protein
MKAKNGGTTQTHRGDLLRGRQISDPRDATSGLPLSGGGDGAPEPLRCGAQVAVTFSILRQEASTPPTITRAFASFQE